MAAKSIYARVSTLDQDCQVQLNGLGELMPRYGFLEYETYAERLSGKEGSRRPELERLLEDAKAGKIDTVMVWKMDRFGRSTVDTLKNIQILHKYGVRFLCPSMGIDTDNRSPTGKFILTVFAAVAELERDFIVERTQGGYRAYRKAYAEGGEVFRKFLSHRSTPHSKSGKDAPVGKPRRIFRRDRIPELLAAGMSRRAIARELGVPESTVRFVLKQRPAA